MLKEWFFHQREEFCREPSAGCLLRQCGGKYTFFKTYDAQNKAAFRGGDAIYRASFNDEHGFFCSRK